MDFQKELIAEYDRETDRTRKTLEAIPEDADFAWKPHAKSMALGGLAAHVSDTNGDWAIHTITLTAGMDSRNEPERSNHEKGSAGAL